MNLSAPPQVELKSLSLSYPTLSGESIEALKDIDLVVQPGGFVCVVGPSGCGKSSLLHLLAGFLHPTCGEAIAEELPINGPDPRRGMVFQHPELYPWLTVYRNVEFGPRMRGIRGALLRERTERCLRMVRLWEFKEAYPYELSGGMQQRAAIARVLANDPHILLMDEPFGALDALTREHLQEELLGLWRQTGKTVIFVTHSVEEAVYLGTDVVVMTERPGRISDRFECPFSRNGGGGNSREVKARPDFVALRERILAKIWAIPEVRGSGGD